MVMYAMLVCMGSVLLAMAPALSKHVMGMLDGLLLGLGANNDRYFPVGWEVGHSSALALVRDYLLSFLAVVAANNCGQLWSELALLVVHELF